MDVAWIDPDPPPIPDRIRKQLEPRRPPLPPIKLSLKPRWVKLAVVAVGLFLVLIVIAQMSPPVRFDGEASARWERLCTDYPGWYQPLHEAMGAQDESTFKDLGLSSVLGDLLAGTQFDPRRIADQPGASFAALIQSPPASARTPEAIRATRLAVAGLDRIEITFEQWPVNQALREQHRLLADHGWTRVAEHIRDSLKHAPPHATAHPGELLRAMVQLETQTAEIAESMTQLEDDLAALLPLGDPVFDALAKAFHQVKLGSNTPEYAPKPTREYVLGSGQDEAHGEPLTEAERLATAPAEALAELATLNASLRPLQAFGRRLRQRVEPDGWSKIDRAAFHEQGRAYALLAQRDADPQAVFRAWLDEVDRFQQPEQDPRLVWVAAQRQRLDAIQQNVRSLEQTQHPLAEGALSRRQRLNYRLATLFQSLRAAGPDALFLHERDALERDIDELDYAVVRAALGLRAYETAAQLRVAQPLSQPPFASAQVNDHWQAERNRLALRLDRGSDLPTTQAEVDRAHEQLLSLVDPVSVTSLPPSRVYASADHDPTTAALLDALTRHTARQRELTYRRALAHSLPVDKEAWSSLRLAFMRQLDQCDAMARDAKDAERLVGGAYALHDPAMMRVRQTLDKRFAAWAKTPLGRFPSIATASAPVQQRLDALAEIERIEDWDMLRQLALGTDQPAYAFAAWRRMGKVQSPDSLTALDAEAAIQARLQTLTQQVVPPARVTILDAHRRATAQARWTQAMQHADDPAQADALAAWADAFDIDPQNLPAVTRFNLLLHRARQGLSDAADDRVLALAQDFHAQTRDLRDDPRVGPILSRLQSITAADARDAEDSNTSDPAQRARLALESQPYLLAP